MDDPAGGYHRDASRVYAMAAATKLSRKWGLSAGVTATLIAAQGGSRLALLIGLLVGVATFRVARFAWCRRMDIPDVPLIADLLPAAWRKQPSPAASPTPDAHAARVARYPRSAHVPVLPGMRVPSVAEVLHGVLRASMVLHGGPAGTRPEQLREGVFKMTDNGFAFLPHPQDRMAAAVGDAEAAVMTKIAGELIAAVALVDTMKDVSESLADDPTLDAWEQEAATQADAFVIPWPRLAGVIVGVDRTVFERARDDGATDDFIVLQTSLELPTLFMSRRLDHELVAIMRARNLAGRDTAEIEAALRHAMASALDGYRELPAIVEQKPWLFQ